MQQCSSVSFSITALRLPVNTLLSVIVQPCYSYADSNCLPCRLRHRFDKTGHNGYTSCYHMGRKRKPNNMKNNSYTYTIRRTNRRTMALEIRPDGTLLVRAPLYATTDQIRQFVSQNTGWIEKHIEKAKARMAERESEQALHPVHRMTEAELRALADQALQDLPPRARHFASLLGVSYGRITIRNQRTRWGSCSSKGNLNFNCLLMLAPENVRDYVVVHELCHRLEMNHSPHFWAHVASILPDYKEQKKWLRDNGRSLMEQMTE